jgi:hypothetical protein
VDTRKEDSSMPFEFPPPLSGSGPSVVVLDPGGAPNTIIVRNDPFRIHVEWSVNQPGASLLGGQWLVRAYAESIGPGQEELLTPALPINVSAGTPNAGPPARLDYQADIDVPPFRLQSEQDPNSSGVYKLVVVVTHQNFGGPTVLAGFSEGPVIQVREP